MKKYAFILLLTFSSSIYACYNQEDLFNIQSERLQNALILSYKPIHTIIKTINLLACPDNQDNTLEHHEDYIKFAHVLYYRYLKNDLMIKFSSLKNMQIIAALVAVKALDEMSIYNIDLLTYAKQVHKKITLKKFNKLERKFLRYIDWRTIYHSPDYPILDHFSDQNIIN